MVLAAGAEGMEVPWEAGVTKSRPWTDSRDIAGPFQRIGEFSDGDGQQIFRHEGTFREELFWSDVKGVWEHPIIFPEHLAQQCDDLPHKLPRRRSTALVGIASVAAGALSSPPTSLWLRTARSICSGREGELNQRLKRYQLGPVLSVILFLPDVCDSRSTSAPSVCWPYCLIWLIKQ